MTAGTDAIELVTDLSRRLRERGIATTTESTIDGVRTLAAVDVADKSDVRLAFRALFVQHRNDLAIFDELFEDDSLGGRGICAAPGGTAPEPGRHRPVGRAGTRRRIHGAHEVGRIAHRGRR